MNFIDFILILVILLSVWSGWRRGFIIGVLELITWVSSLWIGITAYPYIATFIEQHISTMGGLAVPFSFIISIVLARILLGCIVYRILSSIPSKAHIHIANKILGIVPGVANGFVYAALIAILLLLVPFSKRLTALSQESALATKLTQKIEWLETKLAPVLDKTGNAPFNKLTIVPESEKLVKLPYTVTNAKVRPDLEDHMLLMLNKEREKAGLNPLKADPELREVARSHSKDMFSKGYFSHITLEGEDPFDRMRKAGVKFLTAGENLALAQNLSMAHTGLMNSPGHRANILHAAFGRVGIGILDGGIYVIMVTQNFRN